MPVYAFRGNHRLIEHVEPRLAAAGFQRVEDLAVADFALTYCTSMTELEDLYFGDRGLVQTMRPGSIVVDISITTPAFATEMNAIATVSDLKMIEAPMLVKDLVAAEAFAKENMTCFASSDDGELEGGRELLEALFDEIRIVGGPGVAQLAALSNTVQRSASIIAAIESRSLFSGARLSVSSNEMRDFVLEATTPEAAQVLKAAAEGRYEGAYTVEMLMSELSAALMAADDYELIIPQTESAFHILELLAVIGGSDMSPAALALVYAGEEKCEGLGLDWSRADALYSNSDDDGFSGADDSFGFDDDLDDDDILGSALGYSAN